MKLLFLTGLLVLTTKTPDTIQPVFYSGPILMWENQEVNFGHIPEGPIPEAVFKFKNTGHAPLIIQNVVSSCGCVAPSYSREPVLPGRTGEVKAKYYTPGRIGPFHKSLSVTVNDSIGQYILYLKGVVEPQERLKED